MVQMDIQFLAGVAVTVFLALLFFAVVVLWDVALALRSVGDKIDKLEDNLDDDLTEIGHSLDSMSDLSGGGGTQLHLSGGTISGGQPSNQESPPSGARADPRRPDDDRYRQPRRPPGQEARDPDRYADPERDRPADDRRGASETESGDDEPDADADEPATEAETEDVDEADEPEQAVDPDDEADRIDDEAAQTDEADASEDAEEESGEGGDEEDADEDASTAHPLAERNRGRFVTAPGVTPWYVTPLDRDAIANARPEIAGELESPEASSRTEPDEDPIVAGPASEDDIASDGAGVEAAGTGASADGDGPGADGAPEATAAGPERGASGDPTTTSSDESATPMPPDPGATDAADESEDTIASAETDGDERDSPSGTDGDEPTASSDTSPENAADPEPDEPVFTDGQTGTSGPPSTADPVAADETDTVLSYDESDEPDTVPGDSSVPEGSESVDFGDITDLGQPDPDEEDVTVEEAVDAMNDDAPSLSLSSHDFDVVAEADEDGAVLLFEFDPATVELTGSTKRLLRYQMRSFADDESTPDGTVSIEGQTIVVEIPHPEGNDVQRWGEAAVSIIDRTLYLSDNSG